MRFLADTHSHTLASGHAYSTITEMAEAAAAKGLCRGHAECFTSRTLMWFRGCRRGYGC